MRIVASTLLWLHERPHERGTEFSVVEKPDPAMTSPVEVDHGTASLWLRHGKATEAAEGKPQSGRAGAKGSGPRPGY